MVRLLTWETEAWSFCQLLSEAMLIQGLELRDRALDSEQWPDAKSLPPPAW